MIEGPLRTLSDPFLGQFPGQHFAIDDAQGNHIVVEYIEGKPNVYDNTNVGVLTNDPQLPWHLDNLVAYAALSPNRANASDPLLVGVYKQRESMGEPEECVLFAKAHYCGSLCLFLTPFPISKSRPRWAQHLWVARGWLITEQIRQPLLHESDCSLQRWGADVGEGGV